MTRLLRRSTGSISVDKDKKSRQQSPAADGADACLHQRNGPLTSSTNDKRTSLSVSQSAVMPHRADSTNCFKWRSRLEFHHT
jgi:hypothetical protein